MKKAVLMYGAWPNPRTSGISSVVHDVIKGINDSKRDVYLITQDWDKLTQNPLAIQMMRIPASEPFDWRVTVQHREEFLSFEDLVEADARQELDPGQSLLSNVGLIHSHGDELIPHYNEHERHTNVYNTLVDHIAKSSGKIPKTVRTRHDEVQRDVDRLNRFAGIDWAATPLEKKLAILNDGREIQQNVEENIRQRGEEFVEKYHLDPTEMENGLDHVWYVLHLLRQWRREAEYVDAIVNLTEDGVKSTLELTFPDTDPNKFVAINNGTSFEPKDWGKVHELVEGYHVRDELECYRGSSQEKEPINFNQMDKKVIFVGRPTVDKGIFELAESLKRIYHSGNKNIKGIFVGNFDEDVRKELESIDPEHAKEYLLFTGKVDDQDELASILMFGNVTALPSHSDTFNLVGAESLKMKTPIVTTHFSGIGDAYIGTPQRMGFQVALPVKKPFDEGPDRYFGVDVDSLTEQIERMITDDGLAWKLGQNGLEFVEKHLNCNRMGQEYADLFDRLIDDDEKRKIKVSFFCNTLENTHGVPVVMNNTSQQLIASGQYEVSYITNSFDNNEINYIDSDGNEFSFRNRTEFTEFVKREGVEIDVLHSHSWHISDYYSPFHTSRDEMDLPDFLRQLGQPKFVHTNHANPTEDLRRIKLMHPEADYQSMSDGEKRDFLYSNLLDAHKEEWKLGWEATSILSKRQIMELADAIVFVSETQREEEKEMIPHYCFTEKAGVVNNGVDMGNYNNPKIHEQGEKIKEELELEKEERVVLFAGRMSEEKGIYDLAQAAEILYGRNEEVTIVYLGTNHDEDIIERLKSDAPHVRMLFPERISRDERHKMAAMYSMADIVAQPTWGECFNQIPAEALAMGTPSVVSDFSAPGEIYVKTGAALGCQVRDPKDLAEKLSILLNDPEVYNRTKETGKTLVDTQLSVENMAREYKQLYESIC
jgi:glycosyltransferase involved in cell wall biosynthesis